jgi:mannosyltransferase
MIPKRIAGKPTVAAGAVLRASVRWRTVPASGRNGVTILPHWLRAALIGLGVAGIVCAPLPTNRGVGAALAVEGVLLALAGWYGRWRRIAPAGRLAPAQPEPPGPGGDVGARTALVALVAITALAVAVRLFHLDSGLWLDEIVTVDDYADRSLGTIFTSYEGANNHLLNSVLVHWAIAAFGHEDWAIRLPAAVFGVLAVPSLYWVARGVMRRLPSLLAALALAVAYQHVFFSQNARGYAASMLFGLLATGLLLRSLRTDTWWAWVLYVPAAALCVIAVPTGAFVLVGHAGVVVAALVIMARRSGVAVARPLLLRAAGVYLVVGVLLAQAYAAVLSDVATVAQDAWNRPEAGLHVFSTDFANELVDDVTARGSLAGAVAIVAGLAALVGLASLLRRDWALVVALSAGPLLHVAFVVVRGLVFSPRFLVALAFPAMLVAVETVRVLARSAGRLAERRGRDAGRVGAVVQVAGGVLLCAALALPLVAYYDLPKQAYRDAVRYAEQVRGPDGIVVPVYTAQSGVRYYGVEHPDGPPLVEGETVRYARTARALEDLADQEAGRRLVLVTTFERAMRRGRPRLDHAVWAGWRPVRVFRGSVGDGDVTVWLPRS